MNNSGPAYFCMTRHELDCCKLQEYDNDIISHKSDIHLQRLVVCQAVCGFAADL